MVRSEGEIPWAGILPKQLSVHLNLMKTTNFLKTPENLLRGGVVWKAREFKQK